MEYSRLLELTREQALRLERELAVSWPAMAENAGQLARLTDSSDRQERYGWCLEVYADD